MQRVYIETTIPSFLTALPSRDVVMAGKQVTTRLWWETRADRFEMFISPFVLEESALGDPDAARRRLDAVTSLPVLAVDAEVGRIAEALLTTNAIPARASTDASHLAVATRHGMEFFLTWNCTHLANAQTLPKVLAAIRRTGYEPPIVCTPDELMEDSDA